MEAADNISTVPTTLITGFFGVGKTTTLRSLIERKPEDEKWAILVNEFGEVGIDGALLENLSGDGVQIREIVGGCLCCTANVPMRVAVTEILRRTRPDRLLIEPTGIGHPAGLIDELRSDGLADAIDLRAVICLVDPRVIHDARIQEAAVFRDQVAIADVLIAGKADLAGEDDIARFHEWARNLFPPKSHIAVAAEGNIDYRFLDLAPGRYAVGAEVDHRHNPAETEVQVRSSGSHQFERIQSAGDEYHGCGWVFGPDFIFDQGDIADCLGPPGLPGIEAAGAALRAKGVFRVGGDWILLNRTGAECTVGDIAYRRDSRIEVIVPNGVTADWDRLERALLECLKS
jgi:G3E family GTPase